MPENRDADVGGGIVEGQIYHDAGVCSDSYEPRPGDLCVVTYFSRCGGDWVQTIVRYILHGTQPRPKPMVSDTVQDRQASKAEPRPPSILTHLPFRLVFRPGNAKYIYIARNPYDCSALLYEQTVNAKGKSLEDALEDFPAFFDDFVRGRTPCGDYLADLVLWYERRFDDNVLFLTYEELVEDVKTTAIRIADFLDEEGEYGQKLRRNRKMLEKICEELLCRVDREAAQTVGKTTKATVAGDCGTAEQQSTNWFSRRPLFIEKIENGKQQLSHSSIFTLDMVNNLEQHVTAVAGANCRVMQLWRCGD
ncbi:hypothetical protein HPB50_000303 [Hyalomma asiaticum]|uniref:Uncharacterized protein n=1 Tax=Hyalomma asiaticum TaxID=266040 RepID=A0ACB7RQY0_HYAAI|nr:hypothetical protein HPB50_000303 [Hyalomma asiaticum]